MSSQPTDVVSSIAAECPKLVPRTISGTFSGQEGLRNNTTEAEWAWTGSVTWTLDETRSATDGMPEYNITAFHADWSALTPPHEAAAGCSRSGTGSLSLTDINVEVANAFAWYDVWGRRHTPGAYSLGVQRNYGNFPTATLTCPGDPPQISQVPMGFLSMYDTSPGGMAAVTTNPESFAGTFDNPPDTGDGSGRYDFTGTDLVSTPSPFAP